MLDNGAARDVEPEALGPGSHVLVRPGEKIPLDGTVLEGDSQVDTSRLQANPCPSALPPTTGARGHHQSEYGPAR